VFDLAQTDVKALRQQFGVVMERTASELNGVSCLELEDVSPPKQQIMSSRSFGKMQHTIEDVGVAVAWHIHNAAEKLRAQHSVAGAVYVFVQTNRFREQDAQYNASLIVPLPDISDNTSILTTAAQLGLERIWRDGYAYKKCGVMLMELEHRAHRQETLFDDPQAREKSTKLMAALDAVNDIWGRGTLRTGAAGFNHHWAMRSENRSPRYTTKWNELPVAR
jgi:DNA polymerase V